MAAKRKRYSQDTQLLPQAALVPPEIQRALYGSCVPTTTPKAHAKEEEGLNFSSLPDEVKLHLFAMLPPMTLLRIVPQVSTEWRNLSHDDALWRALYRRHIGGTVPLPLHATTPTSPIPSTCMPTQRRQHSTPRQAATSTSPPTDRTAPTWRGSTSRVLQGLKSAFIELRRSLDDLALRHRRDREGSTSRWLAQNVEWMVEGRHAPLLAAFLRDVARFASAGVIHMTLADPRFVLRAAKSGDLGTVTTLVAFGADLGQALLLATMNNDSAGIALVFRSYAHIKGILCSEYRRQNTTDTTSTPCGRRLVGLVAGMRDAFRTCMNLAAVGRDQELLELFTNLCASDVDLHEAHDFAQFVQFDGSRSARARESGLEEDDDDDDAGEDDEEGEDSDEETSDAEL
jgi:hypothetical protein